MAEYTAVCARCGCTFMSKNQRARICSPECALVVPKCAECGVELPTTARVSRRYCSRRCFNVMYSRTRDSADFAAKHKQWRDAVGPLRRAAAIATRPPRFCAECGEQLPRDARLSKEFCSRRCTNQVSLRERAHARREAAQRYQRRVRGPGITAADWARLCARFGGRCAYCGKVKPLTMDHIVPISRGGWHAIGNIWPACRGCNSTKRDRFLIEWRMGRPQRPRRRLT